MASIESYIRRFFFVGKTETVRAWQRAILSKFVSWEVQTLTPPQKLQARKNIGIYDLINRNGKATLTKGTHNLTIEPAFTVPYVVVATGQTAANASVSIQIIDESHLNYFTIKVPVDCVVRWTAGAIYVEET